MLFLVHREEILRSAESAFSRLVKNKNKTLGLLTGLSKDLVGMTATPERCDRESIFDIFDNNVALEVRLREALELNLVIPFHYFGITDIDSIDLSNIDMKDVDEIVRRLKVNERVDFIIEKMNFYGYDGEKRKCIGFCANIDHAQYMTSEFNKRGIRSVCLTGKNSADERNMLEFGSQNFYLSIILNSYLIPSLRL